MNKYKYEPSEILIKSKWSELVSQSRNAMQDFNDFIDDHAICWANDRINRLSSTLAEVEAQRDDVKRAIKLALEMQASGAFGQFAILQKALAKLEANNGK